jgi:hypothetical protein
VKVITLKYSSALEGFPEAPLESFLSRNVVRGKREYFYMVEGVPHLTLVLAYEPAMEPNQGSEESGRTQARGEDWRKLLSESDFALFNALRTWRNQRGREEGVPPYFLATNQQVAEMARLKPKSLQELGSINGFGQSRLQRYGKSILEIIQGAVLPAREAGGTGGPGTGPDSGVKPEAQAAQSPDGTPATSGGSNSTAEGTKQESKDG